MWWYRSLIILICAAVLGACGFRPLYGDYDEGGGSAHLALVKVAPIADRVGQQLHNHLLDLINPYGRPTHPRYLLEVRLNEGSQQLAVQKSELATRANLNLSVSFSLYSINGDELLLTGTSFVVSSYNILKADFATLIAEKDARARATREMAQDIRARVAVFLVQREAEGGITAR